MTKKTCGSPCRPCWEMKAIRPVRLSQPKRGWHCSPRKRSEEHTSELQSQSNLVCRLLLEKNKNLHQRPHTAGRHSHQSGGATRPNRMKNYPCHVTRQRGAHRVTTHATPHTLTLRCDTSTS